MVIGEALKSEVDGFANRMRSQNALLEKARRGKISPAVVQTYLSSIHYLVSCTPICLRLARRRAEALGHASLARYFEHKLGEESGHDAWAESDMEALANRFGCADGIPPRRSILALVDYLRETIDDDPARYLAYILLAEYFTVVMGPEWVSNLREQCGIPADALTVIINHAELDKKHVLDGVREIDDVLAHHVHLDSLRETLHTSMSYFEGFFHELDELVA